MPTPKDPEKFLQYVENQRKIALERGFGKWMKGRRHTPGVEAIKKYTASIKGSTIKIRRGYHCKTCNTIFHPYPYQKNKKYCSKSCYLKDHRELSEEVKLKITNTKKLQSSKGIRISNIGFANPENRKGKTYEQIYGSTRQAKIERLKRKNSHIKRFEGKTKKCRNKQNGEAEYKTWRTAVFERDNYTCQICKIKGGKLNAHHIKSWSKFPELRYVVDNGITLCENDHKIENKKQRINEKIYNLG